MLQACRYIVLHCSKAITSNKQRDTESLFEETSLEENSSCEIHSLKAGLRYPKVRRRSHKSRSLEPILSRINPVPTPPLYYLTTRFIIIIIIIKKLLLLLLFYYHYSNVMNCLVLCFGACLIHSCSLCNWPLGSHVSMYFNKNYRLKLNYFQVDSCLQALWLEFCMHFPPIYATCTAHTIRLDLTYEASR
jgi:hypothetical protein